MTDTQQATPESRAAASRIYNKLCAAKRWNVRAQLEKIGLTTSSQGGLSHGAGRTTGPTFDKAEVGLHLPDSFFEYVLRGDRDSIEKMPVCGPDADEFGPLCVPGGTVRDYILRELDMLATRRDRRSTDDASQA